MPEMKRFARRIGREWELLALVLPTLAFYVIFHYGPMYGLRIAFMDYNPFLGFAKSKWVGLKHFRNFFASPMSWTYIANTLRISVVSFICGYPIPIILALMFNSLPLKQTRKLIQTVFYMPNFVSVVVTVGMLQLFTNNQVGIINQIVRRLGGSALDFTTAGSFLPQYVISGIWSGAGWSTLIYTGALAGVSPELYEAAIVDGASKIQRVLRIDLPSIAPTLSITLILAIGGIMSVGNEKVLLMQLPTNLSVTEIISTYTYHAGIINNQFSFSSAIGLMNSAVNLALVLAANFISRRATDTGLW
ncbi:MAG: ABC transporter permease subunit [Oscillospiraceae bacterium]|jgi:putative aldouronate transport system permease protein|nr:ABC transporter permease subunit [Oscillospiraceae bacterium]